MKNLIYFILLSCTSAFGAAPAGSIVVDSDAGDASVVKVGSWSYRSIGSGNNGTYDHDGDADVLREAEQKQFTTASRTIPLPKFTIDLLTQLHNEAPENIPFVLMNKAGADGICRRWKRLQEQDKDWLNRYWANNIIRKFHIRVKRAEIKTAEKKLTVHVLRKCCIQNWANELPMNVVKELAGHSSIETTNEFYSTVDKSHREAAAKIGDKLLGGNTSDLFLTFSGNSAENQAVNKC